jgi:hypothetical protein
MLLFWLAIKERCEHGFDAEARVMLPFQTKKVAKRTKKYDPWNKSCIQMEQRFRQNEAKVSQSNILYTTHYQYFLHLDHLNHQFLVDHHIMNPSFRMLFHVDEVLM